MSGEANGEIVTSAMLDTVTIWHKILKLHFMGRIISQTKLDVSVMCRCLEENPFHYFHITFPKDTIDVRCN